jgi:hypothetical protein
MKRVFSSLICFLISMHLLLAQQQGYKPIYDNLVPVSPTAFQFLKYTEMPVSEYTGIPGISVPIYTIEEDGVEIPINLTYHAGGVRVNQEASWVGLGWDLTFGSVIQNINDQDDFGSFLGQPNPKVLPDYYQNAIPGNFAYRWKYSAYCAGQFPGNSWTPTLPVNATQAKFGYMVATDYYVPVNGDFNTRRAELFDYEEYDSEPDIFRANFLGHSINFIRLFTNNGTGFVALNKRGYKIEFIQSGNNDGWKITVPSGEIFYFEEKTVSETFSTTSDYTGTSISSGIYKPSVKTWMITKIITKNKKQLQFAYGRTSMQNMFPSFSQKFDKMNGYTATMVSVDHQVMQVAKFGLSNAGGCIDCYGSTFIYSKEEILYPTSISFSGGNVYFTTSSRQDASGIKLDKIDVFSTYSQLVRRVHLNHSYFDASSITTNGFSIEDNNYNKLRLKLNSVTMNDGAVYAFEYSSVDLPRKNSFAVDYWGYYNGNHANISMVPNPVQFNRADIGAINNDNHSARIEFAKAGTLSKIIYPTGGSTQFDFELHEFTNYWVPDYNTSTNNVSKGHGLRVSAISFYADDNNISKKIIYEYESGKAIQPRQIIRTFYWQTSNSFSICGIAHSVQNQFEHYSSVHEINSNGFFSSNSFGLMGWAMEK